jgi:hypothetical protein
MSNVHDKYPHNIRMTPGKVTSLRMYIVTRPSPRPRCTTPPRPVVDENHETPLHKQISLGITSSKMMPGFYQYIRFGQSQTLTILTKYM